MYFVESYTVKHISYTSDMADFGDDVNEHAVGVLATGHVDRVV